MEEPSDRKSRLILNSPSRIQRDDYARQEPLSQAVRNHEVLPDLQISLRGPERLPAMRQPRRTKAINSRLEHLRGTALGFGIWGR